MLRIYFFNNVNLFFSKNIYTYQNIEWSMIIDTPWGEFEYEFYHDLITLT